MSKPVKLVAVLALLLSTVVPPAAASHGIAPTFRTEDVFFKCENDTKVYQVDWLLNLGASSTYAPWDTAPPEASVTDGAGCGALDVGGVTNAVYSPVFEGYFTGNLRDMTVELHHLLLSRVRNESSYELAVHLEIDGKPLFPAGAGEGGRVTVTPVTSETGASQLFEFSITDLGYAVEVVDEEGNVTDVEHGGLAVEDGDGTRSHHILLMVGGADYPLPGAWVWDTTEVPSGISFNPPELAEATLQAESP